MEEPSTLEFGIKLTLAISIFGGNSLVIYLYFVDSMLRHKQANKFVISLAFCDLLVAVIFIPCHELFQSSIQKMISLPIAGYVASMATLGSLWNLTALTYDRFVAIFDGLRYEEVMTNKKVKRLMIGIWVSDFWVTFLPLSWRFFTSDETNTFIMHVYQFILVVVMTVVHLVLIGLYIALFKVNRSQLKFSQRQVVRFVKEGQRYMVNTGSNEASPSIERMKLQCDIEKYEKNRDNVSPKKGDIGLICEEERTDCHIEVTRVNNGAKGLVNHSSREGNFTESGKRRQGRYSASRAIDRLFNSHAVCIELRAAKVILVLFAFNTICWLPTVTLNIVYLISWLRHQPRVNVELRSISSYCFLIYSLVNPWIYGLLKTDFKRAVKKHILKRKREI